LVVFHPWRVALSNQVLAEHIDFKG